MKGLEDYVNKKSSEAELESMTQKLLQTKFDREQKDDWANKLRIEHQVSRNTPQRSSFRGRIRLLTAVAAVIAIGLLADPLVQNLLTTEYQQMADVFLQESMISTPVVRKGEDNVLEARLKLAESINDQDYEQVVELASQLVKTTKPKLEDHFFLGIGHLYEQSYEPAVEALEKARELAKKEVNFQEEIRWYLSLAYLKSERLEDAYLGLSEIVKLNGWKADNAAELLEAIQK